VVPEDQLQDKSDRYYVRDSFRLAEGEVFVSEFDLNQEQGMIEKPLNPVIRFVTPVAAGSDEPGNLLVMNYRGSLLLKELSGISLPGNTWLIRSDGHFLLGPRPDDAWGWLLGHPRSFRQQYPEAWQQRDQLEDHCLLTRNGAFAFRSIELQTLAAGRGVTERPGNDLMIVSYVPAEQVFSTSHQLLNRLLILGTAILLPMLVLTRIWAQAVVRRKQQNRLIAESEKKLRELSARLIRIQEEERRSISRELHDQLGQQATAINLDLKLAEREAGSEAVRTQLKRAIEESQELLDALRHFATRIRPVELDDLGLHDAVESHLWEFKDRTGIEIHLDSNIDKVNLPAAISENVYRLIQESLNNVLKHANATRVDVSIIRNMQGDAPVLCLRVRDNGVGVAGAAAARKQGNQGSDGTPRLGILGMRERVDLLGGTMNLVSQTELGTTINVILPLPASMGDERESD
jgi:signal transduction histidine kinase